MSCKEYIGCKSIKSINFDGKGNDLYNTWLTDEEIIRCRNCKKCDKDEWMCYRDPKHTGKGVPTIPGGFCAWAERDA